MQNAVLDTNVIVSALLSPGGNPAEILMLILNGKLQIHYSQTIISEYEEVLLRSRFGFEPSRVRFVLDTIAEIGTLDVPATSSIKPSYSWQRYKEQFAAGG
ncbi:hypothetical protein FACS1894204_12050 [Synergistales bacterium]|nr:hypothetical protein FACS1894204_12050 [Synergistales bacterium]